MYKRLYINFKANGTPLGCAHYSGIYNIEGTLNIIKYINIMVKIDVTDSNGVIIKKLKKFYTEFGGGVNDEDNSNSVICYHPTSESFNITSTVIKQSHPKGKFIEYISAVDQYWKIKGEYRIFINYDLKLKTIDVCEEIKERMLNIHSLDEASPTGLIITSFDVNKIGELYELVSYIVNKEYDKYMRNLTYIKPDMEE